MASAYPENLECPLCMDIFEEPITISCQHSFCRKCLISTFQNGTCCPICRTQMNTDIAFIKKMVANPILRTLVEEHHENNICGDCKKKGRVNECAHCQVLICKECLGIHKPQLFTEVKEIIDKMKGLHASGLSEMVVASDKKAELYLEMQRLISELESEYQAKKDEIESLVHQTKINMVKWKNIQEKGTVYLENWITVKTADIEKLKHDSTNFDKFVENPSTKRSNDENTASERNVELSPEYIPSHCGNLQTSNPDIALPSSINISPDYLNIGSPVKVIDLPGYVGQLCSNETYIYGIMPHYKSAIKISIDDFSVKGIIPIPDAGNPRGIAISSNSELIISDYENNSIVLFKDDFLNVLIDEDKDGVFRLSCPSQIDYKDGKLAIADEENNRILVIDPEGTLIRNFGKYVLNRPRSVCITLDNKYCVIDENGLTLFGNGGKKIKFIDYPTVRNDDGIYFGPESVTSDYQGNLLISDSKEKSIRVYSSELSLSFTFGLGHMAEYVGLCVLKNGRVAVNNDVRPNRLFIF